jgi:shikimate kinase
MSNYFTPFYLPKPIARVGMMGVGKSTIGSRLAKKLGKPFFDSDQEVQHATGGHSIADIYDAWGEEAFRDTEYLVIRRLLEDKEVGILSTGEGAFIEPRTRMLLQEKTVTIWLKSDLSILSERVQRKARPQLQGGDTLEMLKTLVEERYPVYQFADICVESNDEFYQDTVDRILTALKEFLYPSFSE